MKITFALTQDLSSPSGLGRYLPWAKELVKLGHEITIVALHSDYSTLSNRTLAINGVKVNYVAQMHVQKKGNLKNYFNGGTLFWIVLQATIKLTIAILKQPADVILVGKPHPMNGIASIIYRIFNPKTKLIVDCDDNETASNRFNGDFQRRVVGWFEKWIPLHANVVTSNTFYNLSRFAEYGVQKSKLVYISNGIDESSFLDIDTSKVDDFRNRLGLNNNRIISYIGSLSLPSHPVDLLLRSFKLIKDTLPDVTLLVVGGGEDFDYLKNMACELKIDDHTLFVGRVPHEEVPYYYLLSDVTVDPVYDNDAARGRCPIKIFESWACGVPIVTSDVGDRKMLIEKSKLGLLVEPGDSTVLSIGIIDLFQSPKFHGSGLSLEPSIIREYSWPNLISKFNKTLNAKQ